MMRIGDGRMLRRLSALVMVAGVCGMPAGAAAQAAPGAACELHIWGAGRPNFEFPARLKARLIKTMQPGQLDKSNPLSNVNVFNTVNRATALSDAELRKLLPGAAVIEIVRHDTMIDTDRTPLKRLSGRLAQSSADCYADLIVANLYAIFPNPNAPFQQPGGIVGSIIAGGDRLVVEFWLREFTGTGTRPRLYKRKNDSPMPHVPFMTQQMKDSVEAAANVNLRDFATYVDSQRR